MVIRQHFFCSFLLQCIVVPSCSIPTHLFLHCMLIFCSFGSLSSLSQISVSLRSGLAWLNICSASCHPPARAVLQCLTAKVITPVFSAPSFCSALWFPVAASHTIRSCIVFPFSAAVAVCPVSPKFQFPSGVVLPGRKYVVHRPTCPCIAALFDSQSDHASFFCSFLRQCTSVPALYLHCIAEAFLAQTLFRSITQCRQCRQTSGLPGRGCSQALLKGCTICPLRIPNVFRCLVNMGGPGCPVSLKFKIHCSDLFCKHFSVYPSPQGRRLRMHQNLPFFMKNRPKMAFFWSNTEIFGFRQAVVDPPPYCEGARSKQVRDRGTQVTKTPFTACVCTKICHFS